MTIQDFVIFKDDNLKSALKKIDNNKHGFIIVTDRNGIAEGTLTDGDIRRALLKDISLSEAVSKAYNQGFTHVSSEDDFDKVIGIFNSRKINFLPVVDTAGKLVNIITKQTMQSLLLKGVRPDVSYDFMNADEDSFEYDIFERPWGFYRTILINNMLQSKVISVKPASALSLQEHKKREEHWVIVQGEGEVRIGDSIVQVRDGDHLFIPKGCKHRLTNTSESETLVLIEVQLGQYFGEDDIIRFEDDYGRI